MCCNWASDQLSAYLDHELDPEARRNIDEHVEHCDRCRSLVMESRAMGIFIRRSEDIVDTEAVWGRLEISLNAATQRIPSSTPNDLLRHYGTKPWGLAALATAASIIFLFFVIRNTGNEEHYSKVLSHDHASLAVDFAEVLRFAKSEPKQALAKLVSKYNGMELSNDDTNKYLGYEPAVFKSMPEQFTRVSTHVLNMPCCKCSATICNRIDGTSLIVFEHRDEQPVWFGDVPSIDAQCAGVPCKIFDSAGKLAVSWRNRDRQMTLVGADDLAEVNQWVASLKQ